MNGTTRPVRGIGRLVARHLRAGSGASLIVALMVAVTAFAVAAAPRALNAVGSEQLSYDLLRQQPELLDITGTGNLGLTLDPGITDADTLLGPTDDKVRAIGRALEEPLSAAVRDPIWYARTDFSGPQLQADATLRLSVAFAVDLNWVDRIRVVAGRLPTGWTSSLNDPSVEREPVEIALSTAAAEAIGVTVGDLLSLSTADAVVSAIYEPVDPDDGFWRHATELVEPDIQAEVGAPSTVRIAAFVDPESVGGLAYEFSDGRLFAWLPVVPTAIDYQQLTALQQQVRAIEASGTVLPKGGRLVFRSALVDAIDRVMATMATSSALLSLCASGLIGVLVTVLALGVTSVLQRRRQVLSLLAARGASSLQLRGLAAIEGILLALPAAALGGALAMLAIPATDATTGWGAALVVGLIPPVLFAVLVRGSIVTANRTDLRVGNSDRARAVAEVGVAVLAAVALLLLARRGLVASTAQVGTDPLLAATPVLLTVAVGIGALRVYPAPLVALHRLLRRRGRAASIIGLARAIRDPALGFTAAIALVVGVSVVVLTVVMGSTVRAGLERAATEAIGADALVTGGVIDPPLVAALGRVDGVGAVAALSSTTGVDLQSDRGDSEVTVVATDTAALHALRPDIPQLGAEGGVPALLVADNWGDRLPGSEVQLGNGAAMVVGVMPADVIPGVSGRWLLIDSADAEALGVLPVSPYLVLIGYEPGADGAAVRAALDATVATADPHEAPTVRDQREARADARSPVVAALESLLVLVAGAALALTVIAIVLASTAATARRNRLLGIVGVLGGSRRTMRGILAWELGPVALTALIVGTGLGLALPIIVTSVLDLRVFVGGRNLPSVVIDPVLVVGGVGAFVSAVLLSGLVAIFIGRRLAPARTLRMGDA